MDFPISVNNMSILSYIGKSREIFLLFYFFYENYVSKQNSHRRYAAFCGVTSGSILFAYVPYKGRQAYIGLSIL